MLALILLLMMNDTALISFNNYLNIICQKKRTRLEKRAGHGLDLLHGGPTHAMGVCNTTSF